MWKSAQITAISVMVVGMLAFSALVVIDEASAEWIPYAEVSMSPRTAYTDYPAEFVFEVTNTKSETIQISDFDVHFEWQAEGFVYDLLDGSLGISSGSSEEFQLNIIVPEIEPQIYTATIFIYGQAIGDWYPSTGTWVKSLSLVNVPELTVGINANPTTGIEPVYVDFASYVTGGIQPYTYKWTFGDGTTSKLANPVHQYTCDGAYTAVLVVKDESGQIASDSIEIIITEYIPPEPEPEQEPPDENPDSGSDEYSYDPVLVTSLILVMAILAIIVILLVALIVRKK